MWNLVLRAGTFTGCGNQLVGIKEKTVSLICCRWHCKSSSPADWGGHWVSRLIASSSSIFIAKHKFLICLFILSKEQSEKNGIKLLVKITFFFLLFLVCFFFFFLFLLLGRSYFLPSPLPLVGPEWNPLAGSCRGRCYELEEVEPPGCRCDSHCQHYFSCCSDFEEQCVKTGETVLVVLYSAAPLPPPGTEAPPLLPPVHCDRRQHVFS